MSPPLLFVFSASRGLLKAFGDDVEQIRTAAYAYRQHELWSWAVGDIADGMRRWDPNSDAAHPLVCYCDECRRIDGDWTIPCIRMEILLFRYSPYMLDAPGMEWTPRGQLYWPHANRGSNYEAFTDERYYGDFSHGVRFAKDGEEYYL